MKPVIIRKNIFNSEWEHYVKSENGNKEHWSPGFISNNNIDLISNIKFSINRDIDNNILLFKDINYKNVVYSLVQNDFSLSDKTISELNTNIISPSKAYGEILTVNPAEL